MKGDYLTGDSITIADISIACSLTMPTILYADILAKFDKGPVNDNSRDFTVCSFLTHNIKCISYMISIYNCYKSQSLCWENVTNWRMGKDHWTFPRMEGIRQPKERRIGDTGWQLDMIMFRDSWN